MGYIVGVGATNLDVMGRSGAALIPEDSNPGRIAVSVGGHPLRGMRTRRDLR